VLIALLLTAPLATAQQTAPTAEPAASVDAGRWPRALPFLADEAVKRGYELPLPWGCPSFSPMSSETSRYPICASASTEPPSGASATSWIADREVTW